MPTIQQLNSADSLDSSDFFPVYIQNYGDTRKVSCNTVKEFMLDGIDTGRTETTQYFAFGATSSIEIESGSDVWVICLNSQTTTSLTITLPDADLTPHGTILSFYFSNEVVAFTINLNNATGVIGFPTALATTNSRVKIKFDSATKNWYIL